MAMSAFTSSRRRSPGVLHAALALSLVAIAPGCGGGGSAAPVAPAVPAPTNLAYATNPAVYEKGTAIPANSPTVSGGAATSYSVSPALPAGLALNPTSGVISGTPTAVSSPLSYVVRASNAGGSATANLLQARRLRDNHPHTRSRTPSVFAQDLSLNSGFLN